MTSTVRFPSATRAAVLFALALLAACASKPPEPEPPRPIVAPQQQPASPIVRAQLHTELATGYYERGQMDIALDELNRAVALDAGYAPAYNVYGLVYATIGEDAKAEQNFARALQLAPGESDFHQNWGWYLCTHNRVRESLSEFETAARDPLYRSPEIALVNAGRCAQALGDLRAAENYFRRALVAQPGNAFASYGLAQIAYRDGQYETARGWIKGVMLTTNPPPEGLLLGMCVERKLGDRQAELSYVSQLRNRYPNAPETKAIATEKCE
ncbi:MAG TPA: type IV pilus biogenesis/stability protein PilW [Casimicrobiaceae bacterium]|nr:type IV pilus biogenesis/stability protein PilW [Casimicrobiaceae bacterium]